MFSYANMLKIENTSLPRAAWIIECSALERLYASLHIGSLILFFHSDTKLSAAVAQLNIVSRQVSNWDLLAAEEKETDLQQKKKKQTKIYNADKKWDPLTWNVMIVSTAAKLAFGIC